jgi:hypothetical protein
MSAQRRLAEAGESHATIEDALDEELHRWVIELDNFERLLALQEQLLADGGLIDETKTAQALFRLPAGLAPLPRQLVPWAVALAGRNDELLARARAAVTIPPIATTTRRPTKPAVVPVGLDTLA